MAAAERPHRNPAAIAARESAWRLPPSHFRAARAERRAASRPGALRERGTCRVPRIARHTACAGAASSARRRASPAAALPRWGSAAARVLRPD